MSDHLFVVTGGPGSGKTSLLEALGHKGFRHMPEAGRAIIQDQTRLDGPALPWADEALFAELMLSWELRSYHDAKCMAGPVLMDRGIPDVIGFLRLRGQPVPMHTSKAAELYRYNRKVFIAPFWPEIFTQDKERKQDEAEAKATFEAMASTYSELGYELVHLPLASVEDRALFVLGHLQD